MPTTTTATDTPPYPGDDAELPALAAWMARAARRSGLPPELPVMAALEASGLRNRPAPPGRPGGYFRGDPTARPELQLRRLIERAREELARRPQLREPARWGEWVAAIRREAPRCAARYDARLPQARALLGELGATPHGARVVSCLRLAR